MTRYHSQTVRGAKLRVITTVAVGVGILLVAGPQATAKNKRKSPVLAVTASAQVGNQPVTLEPQCPGRTKAIGGGFASGGVVERDPSPKVVQLTFVYESHRAGPKAWRTSAVTLHNPDAGPVPVPPGISVNTLTATAYCKSLKGGIVDVSSNGSGVTAPDAQSMATASCPRGRVAISGGFASSPVPGPTFAYPSIFESYRSSARRWTAAANPWAQASVAVTSYVDCFKAAKPPLQRLGTKAIPGTVGTRPCPGGLQAGDGGFMLAPNSGAVAGMSMATDAGSENRKSHLRPGEAGLHWNVTGGNPLGGNPAPTAFAYCS
jgi:hypothetical protein